MPPDIGIAPSPEPTPSLHCRPVVKPGIPFDESTSGQNDDNYSTLPPDDTGILKVEVDRNPREEKRPEPIVQISPSESVKPRSSYANWEPFMPVYEEETVINDLFRSLKNDARTKYTILKLDDFCVYRSTDLIKRPGEFQSLHDLTIQIGANELLFDGILSVGDKKRYVQCVKFQELTVEGYGDPNIVSLQGKICIRSRRCKKSQNFIWYELGSPDPQYRQYHEAYLWIAHLGKYFVDFLIETDCVSLNHFRCYFHNHISCLYGKDSSFIKWYAKYGSVDFRQAVVANIDYLWKECCGLSRDYQDLTNHQLWDETLRLNIIPEQPTRFEKTVVTPFVQTSFRNMPFVSQMETFRSTNEAVRRIQVARRQQMKLTPLDCPTTQPPEQIYQSRTICKGDVVCIRAETDNLSQWRNSIAQFWYAYVQSIHVSRSGRRLLDLLWLYEPKDTTLGQGYYPFQNELFMSDNCSCGHDAVDAELVLGVVDVCWFATDPNAQRSFFARRKYRTIHEVGAYDFVTLKVTDFKCRCDIEEADMQYKVGDTVLVRTIASGKTSLKLEPGQITKFSQEAGTVTIRRLMRLGAKANQIAFTEQYYSVSPSEIARRCCVRIFPDAESVPSPFDRGGAGDLFFILASSPLPLPRDELPSEFTKPDQKLKGLGVFCGGGNFDRGLEEGGAVDFKYAVDWADHAIHTYRANLVDPQATQLFFGSVNDYLAMAVQGSGDRRVAKVGDIEFIAAGSPCPGFSSLQADKQSEQSLRNCSLVAAVVSQVDVYTPKYMILENVTGLANHPKGRPDLNVFSQILCCLVAIGYQVQQYQMDPRAYGSPQSRARIFIIATAPGCTPPPAPPITHSDPNERIIKKAIGKCSNGVTFGERRSEVSPFEYVSASAAMDDLPDISNAHINTCIKYPDHRVVSLEGSRIRNLLTQIPRWPYGMSFMQTYNMQFGPGERTPLGRRQIERHSWQNKHMAAAKSKSYSRIYPNGSIPCLTTAVMAVDSFLGRQVHWDQPRVITVMEARRTQGFPDSEIVIGNPRTQWKIIGNSVDRKVALALGLSLGRAWQQTLENQDRDQTSATLGMTATSTLTAHLEPGVEGVGILRGTCTTRTTRKEILLPLHASASSSNAPAIALTASSFRVASKLPGKSRSTDLAGTRLGNAIDLRSEPSSPVLAGSSAAGVRSRGVHIEHKNKKRSRESFDSDVNDKNLPVSSSVLVENFNPLSSKVGAAAQTNNRSLGKSATSSLLPQQKKEKKKMERERKRERRARQDWYADETRTKLRGLSATRTTRSEGHAQTQSYSSDVRVSATKGFSTEQARSDINDMIDVDGTRDCIIVDTSASSKSIAKRFENVNVMETLQGEWESGFHKPGCDHDDGDDGDSSDCVILGSNTIRNPISVDGSKQKQDSELTQRRKRDLSLGGHRRHEKRRKREEGGGGGGGKEVEVVIEMHHHHHHHHHRARTSGGSYGLLIPTDWEKPVEHSAPRVDRM